MSDVDMGLVGQHLTRVSQLGVKAQGGESVDVELGQSVADAVDHFAKVYNPAAQLDSFIGHLRFNADLIKDNQPAHAETLFRAASMAARVSIDSD